MKAFLDQIRQCESRYYGHNEQREKRAEVLEKLRKGEGGDWTALDEPSRLRRRVGGLGITAPAEEGFVSLPSTEEHRPVPRLLERIIETNELLSSSFLLDGAGLARSVGRVVIRSANNTVVGFGTGFLVSPRLVMTNNHVLETALVASNSLIQFDFRERRDGTVSPSSDFRLRPNVFFLTNVHLDFTLVAIEPVNAQGDQAAARGWTPLIAESGKAIVGERVNIIQHPGGEPQQIALRENEIRDVVDDFLHYSADTLQGSSGSPVNNDQWELAALHHAGVPERNDNNQILLNDGSVWDGSDAQIGNISWKANEGVRISRIVEHINGRLNGLTSQQRELYQQAFSAPPPTERAPVQVDSGAPLQHDGPALRLDSNGNAIWTLPLQIQIGLGDTLDLAKVDAVIGAGDSPAGGAPVSGPPDINPPDIDPPDIDQGMLQRALSRISENANLPYYDEAADQQAIADYYQNFPANLSKATRTRRLMNLLKDTHANVLGYKTARLEHLYPWIDLHEDRQLRSIYSGKGFSPQEVIRLDLEVQAFREARLREVLKLEDSLTEERFDEILDAIENSSPFNCEHVVPQSWFAKAQPMKADLHHLFTCESGCNSFRSNIPYFQFSPLDEVIREDCGRRETAARQFEPTEGKGPVARATLYFLLRYPGLVGDENRELQKDRLNILLDWHQNHPVTVYECHRNAEIAKIQGNRNPLIDHPDWAEKINFGKGFGD